MAHRIGREACCRIGVAVAALDGRHRNVRWRRQTGRGGAVVAGRAVGIGGRVGELAARPAGKARGRAGVAGDAIFAIGRDVAGERRRALRTLGALAGVRPVVTGVAPAGADRAVIHGVGRETRCRIVVAVAALNCRSPERAAASSCRSRWCRCGSSSSWCRWPHGRGLRPTSW